MAAGWPVTTDKQAPADRGHDILPRGPGSIDVRHGSAAPWSAREGQAGNETTPQSSVLTEEAVSFCWRGGGVLPLDGASEISVELSQVISKASVVVLHVCLPSSATDPGGLHTPQRTDRERRIRRHPQIDIAELGRRALCGPAVRWSVAPPPQRPRCSRGAVLAKLYLLDPRLDPKPQPQVRRTHRSRGKPCGNCLVNRDHAARLST